MKLTKSFARTPAALYVLCCLPWCGWSADSTAEPALVRAVRIRQESEWRRILEMKVGVEMRDAAGNSALHFAALNHDLFAVNALLAAGLDADGKNQADATPLLYGAGHPGIVRALLGRGANPNASSKLKNTPLLVAVAHPESYEATRLLLDAGADLNARKTSGFAVVLRGAVSGGDRQTIDLLLERGAAKEPKSAAAALNAAAITGISASSNPCSRMEPIRTSRSASSVTR